VESVLFCEGGEKIFDFAKPEKAFAVPGHWANVDGRLGVITIVGSGMKYIKAKGYHPGMAVCADVLCGSDWAGEKHFEEGEEVARRVIVFLVEANAKETANAVESVHVSRENGMRRLRMENMGPERIDVPLLLFGSGR